MSKVNFREISYDETLDVTGGLATLITVLGAVATTLRLGGGMYDCYKIMEDGAYKKAYKQAYDQEMLNQNLANPIPLGDLIREHYE